MPHAMTTVLKMSVGIAATCALPAFFVGCTTPSMGGVAGTSIPVSGYATKAKNKRGELKYSIHSLLYGRIDHRPCVKPGVYPGSDPSISLFACGEGVSGDEEKIAYAFTDTIRRYGQLVGGVRVARINLTLVPKNQGRNDAVERLLPPDALVVDFSMRYEVGNENFLRQGVRDFVHELFHLNKAAVGWKIDRRREEYLAALMESCVETRVFGDTKGYVFKGDLVTASIGGLDGAQKNSVNSWAEAYKTVAGFRDPTGVVKEDNPAFEEFCRRQYSELPLSR